ncbi:hypothetical protein [Xanthobacter autotrophicus]|uniref:hypothetical protein n=1 Tax=Xanthobacter autotrophicus TaxID=280 RepID=UPI0037289B67
MSLSSSEPVIIGVGQSIDRIDAKTYKAWSASDLAADAARAAVHDAGLGEDALRRFDAIATTRTFEDSRPQPAIFGKSRNFPRSVARRLGMAPRYAAWAKAGGNTPQDLVNEFSERIAAGEFNLVLLAGAEAISTVRSAQARGITLDFSEDPGGEVEDRGAGLEEFRDPLMGTHGLGNPTLIYAIAENARRKRLGLTREAYARDMGDLFAPLAAVAHSNPWSAWDVPAYGADELTSVGPHNRWIADPYPLRLVARDQVNLGAAVLLASRQAALDLGVPADRLVYLHGYARAVEKSFLYRPDLGASPAAAAASRLALRYAGAGVDDVAAFDFYSCFPIAVSNVAIDAFGLSPREPRGLSVTGGLPFFGGPGNNYSMHAIAQMVEHVRKADGRPGFVGANGGYLSKYTVGLYSSAPQPWKECDSRALQAELDAVPSPEVLPVYEGRGRVESYTVHHNKEGLGYAVVVGRTADDQRFIARSAEGDRETCLQAHEQDVIEMEIDVKSLSGINSFNFLHG